MSEPNTLYWVLFEVEVCWCRRRIDPGCRFSVTHLKVAVLPTPSANPRHSWPPLQNELGQLKLRRLKAAVSLNKVLGGGWQEYETRVGQMRQPPRVML
jgi:hypothetical protein